MKTLEELAGFEKNELDHRRSDTIATWDGKWLNTTQLSRLASNGHFLPRSKFGKGCCPEDTVIGAYFGNFVSRCVSKVEYEIIISELQGQAISEIDNLTLDNEFIVTDRHENRLSLLESVLRRLWALQFQKEYQDYQIKKGYCVDFFGQNIPLWQFVLETFVTTEIVAFLAWLALMWFIW